MVLSVLHNTHSDKPLSHKGIIPSGSVSSTADTASGRTVLDQIDSATVPSTNTASVINGAMRSALSVLRRLLKVPPSGTQVRE
jgi:hypothetical protein